MDEVKCPFCDIYSDNIVINENGYTGKKCDKCKTIFISPRPDNYEIIELYKKDNAHMLAESHIHQDFVKRLYARHNLSLIKRYIKAGSLLEIGAGEGYFLAEAKSAGFEVCGIELKGKYAHFIDDKLGIDCETAPLNETSFEGKKFDLIYHCNVISHLYDPIDVFNMINFRLKDEGFVVFETGNFGDVDYEYYKYITRFHYPNHLFFFSENSLEKLLEQTGFDLIKTYNYSMLPEFILDKNIKSILSTIKGASTKNTLKKNDNISHDASNKNKHELNSKPQLKQFAIDIYKYLFYLIRYNVGSIYFKKGRPQTIIVIAQKRKM
jgi:2-polyprenyl-3-methyl-5-hydroxy-6-metoxy-1,4-benzoquinol methylase